MIILITGPTHAGKTNLAQKLLEKFQYPYLSQDHLKMGLIRSGCTTLTPKDKDEVITEYLWPVTREMIKTAIENNQNLIVEGCYIPFNWKSDFGEEYIEQIKYICICFSEDYIRGHFAEIKSFANCIEDRLEDEYCTIDLISQENGRFINGCKEAGCQYICVEKDYKEVWDYAEKMFEQ